MTIQSVLNELTLPKPVCAGNDFPFAAAYLDHGHVYGMTRGLIDAGGTCRYVYSPHAKPRENFLNAFPGVKAVDDFDVILNDPEIKMVASAAITSERAGIGMKVMQAGKDYFVDKAPFTTLEQLEEAKKVAQATGKKYMVYYGERLHSEAGMAAGYLLEAGLIGDVVQIIGLGPHRLNAPGRPAWFFEKARYGGILTDIGSHQLEQFLHYSGAKDATVAHAMVRNCANPAYPELEDYGEATLVADNGCSFSFRVDWLTPDGLGSWGDGRTLILGTEGYIELRKQLDIGHSPERNHVFMVNGQGQYHENVTGKVGCPFFGQLITDCLNRTEMATTQAHAFKAAELSLLCQRYADEHPLSVR